MLQKKMALRGIRNSQSITLVSGSQPPSTAAGLFVNITLPETSPYPSRIATIDFDWVDDVGQEALVTGFNAGSLILEDGADLVDFVQHSPSRYSVRIRFTKRSGTWALIVRKDSASLTTNPNIKGPNADTSATMELGINLPYVNIGVPAGRPVTDRPVPLTFEWVYSDDTPVPVENFDVDEMDIRTDVGDIQNFAQVPNDPSQYTAELVIPEDTINTEVTITVPADVAQVVNSNPPILGPEEDTSITFDIDDLPPIAMVTGADEVCVLTRDIVSNDFLNDVLGHLGSDAGGAFTGVLESASIGDALYLVVQVRKFTQTVDEDGELVTPENPQNFLSDLQAGAALVRVNTANCQFELLKAYSDVTLAARSLTVDGSTLYFIEGSHYMYEDAVIFSDSNWREKVGYIRKIEHPARSIEAVGLNWRSATTTDNPDTEETDYFYGVHGATTAPIAISNEALHIITGFGNFDDIGQPRGEHPVDRIGNWNWIQYHDQINQRLSEVLTNGRTGFDILKDIAIITNSIIGFKNNTFFLRPREPQKAVNGGGSGITATQRTITATDLNWGEFPSEGYLFIDGELIQHNGIDANGHFSDVVRGAEGTTAAAHTGNFDIQFVDHILSLNADTLEMPLKSVVLHNDNRQLYNRVRLQYGEDESVLVEDATSIAENGARLLEVDVPLDAHQREWAEWLAESYLARFKDIHQVIQLTLKPTFFMSVGDVVYLKIPERLHLNGTLCQALEIRHSFRAPPHTFVKLVTL